MMPEEEELKQTTREKVLFHVTAFFVLVGIFSLFAFLFLVPFVIDPALSTITAAFNPIPADCVTVSVNFRRGSSNCTWASCREGCTREVYECLQVRVDYRRLRDPGEVIVYLEAGEGGEEEEEEEEEATQEEEEEEEECDGDVPMVLEAASTSSALNAASDSPMSSQQSGGVHVASDGKDLSEQKNHLRNYKNMTRERRMEANARERTRVHTISAAFDTLRRAVPAYAHNQRLSKLSVLRIACAYIVTLSRVAGKDYSAANDAPSLADCVDSVTRTIQTEGKVRRRRDE